MMPSTTSEVTLLVDLLAVVSLNYLLWRAARSRKRDLLLVIKKFRRTCND